MLHVETYGNPDGAPVLAIHGITGFGARFGRLAAAFPDRRWLCPDLRGHGRSPATPPWRTEDHIGDLLGVLDAHGVERADVIGHSFGGHLAVHLLATAPGRVGRFVLLDPASLLDPAHVEPGVKAYTHDEGWPTEQAALAEIETWFPNEDSKPDFALELERNLVHDDDGRWRPRYSSDAIVGAFDEMVRPFPDLPDGRDALLVEADPQFTSVNEPLRAALRSAFGDGLSTVVLAGATHVVFRTDLSGTVDALRPVLAG